MTFADRSQKLLQQLLSACPPLPFLQSTASQLYSSVS